MAVQWIKDVDTGELYPVQNDFDYETPAHLETPEYMTIDYDKTKQMTIEQLQNQLIAAQNHIEAIEGEKTSDNSSVAIVNEVSSEIVSISRFKYFISECFPIFILIGILAILVFLAVYAIKLGNNGDINISYSSEQKTVDVDYEITPIPEIGSIPIYKSEQGTALYLNRKEQEQPQEQQETEQEQSDTEVMPNGIDYLINKLLSLASILLPVLVSLFAVRFLFNLLRNSM